MVHNNWKILDEGLIKYVDELINMPVNLNLKYMEDYENLFLKPMEKCAEYVRLKTLYKEAYHGYQNILDKQKELDDIYYCYNELSCFQQKMNKLMKLIPSCPPKEPEFMEHPDEVNVNDYYGIKPFNRSIMINISPNWKNLEVDDQRAQILFLETVIRRFYKDCDFYTNGRFVIECGGDGNFIHAHCVFELNPKNKKTVLSQIKKGSNYKRGFLKIWKNVNKECDGGYEGMVEGKFAFQTNLINKKEILDDKLDYLIEEKKPESHQNAVHDICPVLIDMWD